MIEKIKQFFTDVKIETKKVVYPNREELIGSTWVVIITVMVISVFLGVVDLALAKIVGLALRQ
ncbi:MAG: preprotein translocase subunit SecE [Nitrospirota bacterium]|nr:preprotein translocase subunit SecE [Nitrospirota bacterium]